jgi:hypothetical protein
VVKILRAGMDLFDHEERGLVVTSHRGFDQGNCGEQMFIHQPALL